MCRPAACMGNIISSCYSYYCLVFWVSCLVFWVSIKLSLPMVTHEVAVVIDTACTDNAYLTLPMHISDTSHAYLTLPMHIWHFPCISDTSHAYLTLPMHIWHFPCTACACRACSNASRSCILEVVRLNLLFLLSRNMLWLPDHDTVYRLSCVHAIAWPGTCMHLSL